MGCKQSKGGDAKQNCFAVCVSAPIALCMTCCCDFSGLFGDKNSDEKSAATKNETVGMDRPR